MRGDTVIVRDAWGEALVRRVWEATDRTVHICSEENFQALVEGREGLWPVAFPREDVFCYDVSLVAELTERVKDDPSLWKRLTVWTS